MKKTVSFLFIFIFCNLSAIPKIQDFGVSSYILLEPNTGKILASFNENSQVEPASLTKLMTSFVVADYIEKGFISLEDKPTISIKAWKAPGSKMFIRESTQVKVDDLIKGMIVQSGNDASIALAEHVAGTEENFVYLMNDYAKELGMQNTSFNNASGLPDPLNLTTAFDLALLTSSLIKNFPSHYENYSNKSFSYNSIEQKNRNRLLWRDKIFDGVKTGWTESAGYCLIGSAKVGDMRLVAVVLGSQDDKRFNDVASLINYGFRYFVTERKVRSNESLKKLKVVGGVDVEVSLGVVEDIVITLQKDQQDSLRYEIEAPRSILAPVFAGDVAGNIKAYDDENNLVIEQELVYLESVESLGFLQRILSIIWNWIKSLFT